MGIGFGCTRCTGQLTLVKAKDNNYGCILIPMLYSDFFLYNYAYDFYTKVSNRKDQLTTMAVNDYNFNKYKDYYPCKLALNLGTEDNPLYPCIQCHDERNFF